jgi:hypothetical protein
MVIVFEITKINLIQQSVTLTSTAWSWNSSEGANSEERQIIIREDKRPRGEHARRYNAQSVPEVAILMDNESTETRDIVLRLRDGVLKRISELHPSYDSLQVDFRVRWMFNKGHVQALPRLLDLSAII